MTVTPSRFDIKLSWVFMLLILWNILFFKYFVREIVLKKKKEKIFLKQE
jgi:hypothetical protein